MRAARCNRLNWRCAPQPMLRISRSCLVNMNYVKEVNRTLRGDFILVLAGGATVTSSEGFRGKVKSTWALCGCHSPPERWITGNLSADYSNSSGAKGAKTFNEKRCNRVVSGSVCQVFSAPASPLDHSI